MSKKHDRITELMLPILFRSFELMAMARDLEKIHRTKVVAAEICLIADNGEVVYKFWTTKRTKKHARKLLRAWEKAGLKLKPEVRNAMTHALPFMGITRPNVDIEDD
jgi:hypothetical protein